MPVVSEAASFMEVRLGPFLADVGLRLERAEMWMIRSMCGVSILKNRKTGEKLRNLGGVDPFTIAIRSGRLRWYEHVMRTG